MKNEIILSKFNPEQKRTILNALISGRISKEELLKKEVQELLELPLPIFFNRDEWSNHDEVVYRFNGIIVPKERYYSALELCRFLYSTTDVIEIVIKERT